MTDIDTVSEAFRPAEPPEGEQVIVPAFVMAPQSTGEIPLVAPQSELDAWGFPRDEWMNRPTMEELHQPRVDGAGAWYDCRECDASYPSLSGLLMHRNRIHISDALKEDRRVKMSDAQKQAHARKKEENRVASTLVGEDPEVQAILAKTRVKGSPEADARRKRWYNAEKKGMTEGQFEAKELQRAIDLAADPSIVKEPANKRPHRKKSEDDAAMQADDLFERIGKATDILFPNGVPGAHVLPVAELQKDMLALMQALS